MNIVVFTDLNAKILIAPPHIDQLVGLPNVVLSPDLSHVHGLPPHHWKQDGAKIIPMSDVEKQERDRLRADRLRVISHEEKRSFWTKNKKAIKTTAAVIGSGGLGFLVKYLIN